MARRQATSFILLASAALLASGCTSVHEHQGYVMDPTLVSGIQAGVDNRDSVQNTLGRPTFTGEFDQRDWYYLSRDTRALAFNMPRPKEQTVLHVRFDEQGNVTGVDRTGMEKVVMLQPMEDKTPTLGRQRSFFQELFSNIGTVGSMGGGSSSTGGGSGR